MAGVPFDFLDPIGTPGTAAAARQLLARRKEFAGAKLEAERLLRRGDHGLSVEAYRALRLAVRAGGLPAFSEDPPPPQSAVYAAAATASTAAESQLQETLERELASARRALLESTRRVLTPYLVFGGAGVREVLLELMTERNFESLPPRRKKERARERHLLLYLQRICAKNDTLSEFAPGGWGAIGEGLRGVRLAPEPGIATRETFLERWTAHGVAAALNADPEVRMELSPRLHPNGRIDGNQFVFADTAETAALDPNTLRILLRCDGDTPGYRFGDEIGALEQLAAHNMIRWEAEVPALDPYAFNTLVSDILRWRDSPVRARWLELVQPLAALPLKFAQANETTSRAEVMDEARRQLQNLGAVREGSDRSLAR